MYYVYGYDGCSFCKKAVDLLTKNKLPFTYYDIKEPSQKDKYTFLKSSGFSTVPQIFTEDRHIGGYEQLLNHLG